MAFCRNLFTAVTLLVAIPLSAQIFGREEPRRIDILIDLAAHRAYVPVGTVLPPGATLRVKTYRSRAFPEGTLDKRDHGRSSLAAQPPLIFEYAPEGRFAEMRKHFPHSVTAKAGRFTAKPFYRYTCATMGFFVELQGERDTYPEFFESGTCYDADKRPPEEDTNYFTAYVAQEDRTSAWISDQLGNYNCNQSAVSAEVECAASHTSPILTYIGNTVDTWGSAWHMEFVNHEANWVGVEFWLGYYLYGT